MKICKVVYIFQEIRANQIWSSMKHRLQATIQHQSVRKKQHQVLVVKPLEPTKNCSSDNQLIVVETKHLKTYRTILNFIDFLINAFGVSIYTEVDINSRFIFSTAWFSFAHASLFYTIVVVWPNISTLLEVVCLFGIMLPVCARATAKSFSTFAYLNYRTL